MADNTLDLISMADISRLAGQSRATVGNWKSRNPDFPPERGRGSRGPLYDRAEVVAWLEATDRLDKRPNEVEAIWTLMDIWRGEAEIGDAALMLLALLAVMSKSTPEEWQQIRLAAPSERDETVRSAIHSHFPLADELLPGRELPTEFLTAAMSTISTYDRDRRSVMADALLEQFAKAAGYRSGEYLTPESVRQLIIGLAEPVGTVYDPAAGTGQLLIEAFNATNAPTALDNSAGTHLTGQEVNRSIWAMAQLNLAIHGVHAEVSLGDTFRDDQFPNLRADRIMTVPPWNQKLSIDDRFNNDPRWIFGEPGPNDGNSAWIQHCLYHLAENGRAVLVLPYRTLFEHQGAARIRQRIIKAGLLDAVIALPDGLFAWTPIQTAVLVFSKRNAGRNAQPASLMVDLVESGVRRSGQTTALATELIDEVAETYRRWTRGEPPHMENVALARFDDIAANDFVIIPAWYMPPSHDAADVKEAVRKKSDLLRRLETLSAASRDADEQLKMLLGTTR